MTDFEKTEQIYNAFKKTMNHYVCLQKEEMFLEYDKQHDIITIRWHVFMDRYINMKKVFNIARFLHRYTDVPIYSSFGKLNI